MDMTEPHGADPAEDPERHVGQEIADPWPTVPGPEGAFIGTAPIPDPPLLTEAKGWFEENKPAEDPRDSWPGY